MGLGIDWGNGTTNLDPKTGIRFGVISTNEISSTWFDCVEDVYAPPHCSHCGSQIPQEIKDNVFCCDQDEKNRTCPHCEKVLEEKDFYEEEPIGCCFIKDGYRAYQDFNGTTDIFIEESPYYTLCGYCSPCAPGAGYIMQQEEDGIRAYCFGHDFFEDGKAPYKVFDTKTDKEII
jgi:ribosomal protein L37AE/L43A